MEVVQRAREAGRNGWLRGVQSDFLLCKPANAVSKNPTRARQVQVIGIERQASEIIWLDEITTLHIPYAMPVQRPDTRAKSSAWVPSFVHTVRVLVRFFWVKPHSVAFGIYCDGAITISPKTTSARLFVLGPCLDKVIARYAVPNPAPRARY